MGPPESAPAPATGPRLLSPACQRCDAESVARAPLLLQAEPILAGADWCAALCGLSERTWWKLHATGQVPEPVRVGRRLLWIVAEVKQWALARCPARGGSR
jgi:predicted DNA-binding transcriptional regulator AlpA